MTVDLPVIAGMVSTTIFAASTLPMLVKAARTRDLHSYSLPNLLLSNLGNVVHSVYVFHLPAGPIWVLHSFYVLAAGFMLLWYLRHVPARATTFERLSRSRSRRSWRSVRRASSRQAARSRPPATGSAYPPLLATSRVPG